MELLFYFISGILYALLAMFAIFFVIAGMYGAFKAVFWVFETFGIENPFIVVCNYILGKK